MSNCKYRKIVLIENKLVSDTIAERPETQATPTTQLGVCSFGSIDTRTGVIHDGYMEEGKMKFRLNLKETIKNWLRPILLKN